MKAKSRWIGLAGLLLAAFVAAPLQAQERVGFVNTAQVLQEAPQAEAARKKLEAEFAPRDQRILEMQRAAKKLEDELASATDNMSEALRRQKERQLIQDKREIKHAREEFNEDLNLRRNDELSKLQKLVFDTILALAEEEKFSLVLGDNVLYASKQVDLTERVLRRLRRLHAAAQN